jgi:hypothetical protein
LENDIKNYDFDDAIQRINDFWLINLFILLKL